MFLNIYNFRVKSGERVEVYLNLYRKYMQSLYAI